MRRLAGWMGVVWLVVGCTVPDLEEVMGGEPRACNAEHPCGEGYLCVQGACVASRCQGAEPVVGYRDADGDGSGLDTAHELFCGSVPSGYATQGGDCDDASWETYPGAQEVCDGRDNDCRNGIDDGLPPSSFSDFFLDADGDGVGAGVAVRACAAPPRHVAVGGDCDDANSARTPGKVEVCDEADNDCNDLVDEGLVTGPFYRDADGDGFGVQSDVVQRCRAPAGYVAATTGFDCDDASPSVKPGATELCNDVDDNCVDGVDEVFTQKGEACNNDVCVGQFVCNAARSGTECSAPAPVSYYSDVDGDGEGSQAPADMVKVCAPDAPPAGYLMTSTDCDDRDPHNKSTGTELCDDRDNTCDGVKDEGDICGGKGWKVLTSPTIPSLQKWNTVAVGAGGYPVWIAGDSGALAFRTSAGSPFNDVHQKCGISSWRAAWVRPSDGQVFLAGDGGSLASYSGSGECITANTSGTGGGGASRPLTGIVGFESGGVTTVHVVNDSGNVYAWTPGSNPVFRTQSSELYMDMHGHDASRLFPVGNSGTSSPAIRSYDALTGGGLTSQAIVGVPGSNKGGVLGVWVVDGTRAYAVGQSGLFLKWDGNNTWNFASPDSSMVMDLASVVAFDDASVYVAGNAMIRRPTSTGWVVHFDACGELKDIAAASRQDIWAVGPGGCVVHFPE